MWFTSVYLKTLREARIAILGWGLGMGLLLYAVLSAVPSLIGTPQERASLISLAQSFTWFADPVGIGTPGGYATWKYGLTILIIAIWPIIACNRVLRGEEERGSMDVLLSLPRSRMRIALEKLAAIWTALLLMGLLIGLLCFVGGQGVNAGFGAGGAWLFGLNIVLLAGVFGSLALLVSQCTQERRVASGITGGLLIFFILLDMVHRVIPNTDWISRLSPVYYYNLSKPLVPSYGTNVGGLLVMLALSLVLSGVALAIFVRRDIGRVVTLPGIQPRDRRTARSLPVNDWSLRSIYTRGLGMLLVPACWWTLGIAGFAAWMVVIVKQTETGMSSIYQSSPMLKDFLSKVGRGDITQNATILSALYVLLPLLLMTFAVTQANRWSADEEEGQLDLILSTPHSRLQVILGRFAALTTATIVMSMITLIATEIASVTTGIRLDAGNVAAATLSIIPLGLLVAALGYFLSGWLSTAIDTGLLSFVLVIWFFISFVGPSLNWSDAVLHLSAVYYYGTPLLHGLPLGDTLGVVAVLLIVLAFASFRFARKDIGR
jgi:ABC-2 type transport system permease protein